MKKLDVGEKAPLWTLPDQHDNDVSLKEYIGIQNIILSFHPLAWTPVCARQMQDLEENFETMKRINTVAFGMSVDHAPCKKAWADSLGIRNTVLPCDFWPHGKAAQEYGVFNEKAGFSDRAVFVLDMEGKVSFRKVYPIEQLPDLNEVLEHIRAMNATHVMVAPR